MTSMTITSQEASFVLRKLSVTPEKENWDPKNDQSVSDLQRRLLRAFQADESRSADGAFNQALLWHYDSELCHIQRPLYDLNNVSQAELDDCIICVHTYDQSEDPGDQQVNTAKEAINAFQNAQGRDDTNGTRTSSQHSSGDRSFQQDALRDDDDDDRHTGKITLLTKFKSFEQELPLPASLTGDKEWNVVLDWGFDNVVDFLRDQTAKGIGQVVKFDEHPYEITFRPVIKLDGKQGRYAKFDIYRSTQIDRLKDLFVDPKQDITLTMEVRISSNDEPCKGTAVEKLKDYCREEPLYYHIGQLGMVAALSLKIGDTSPTCAAADQGKSMKCAPTDHMLLGRLIRNKLEMYLTPVWHANGHLLGYVHSGTMIKKIPPNVNMDARYDMATPSIKSIGDFLYQNRNTALGTALSANDIVRPFYSFNVDTVEKGSNRPAKWPKHDIALAGPFKTYLDQSEPILGGFHIIVRGQESFADIEGLLDKQLKGVPRSGEFMPKGVRKSKYQLWILPQTSGGNKMLPYNGGSLLQYMTVERLKEEKKLYMEAHLVKDLE